MRGPTSIKGKANNDPQDPAQPFSFLRVKVGARDGGHYVGSIHAHQPYEVDEGDGKSHTHQSQGQMADRRRTDEPSAPSACGKAGVIAAVLIVHVYRRSATAAA